MSTVPVDVKTCKLNGFWQGEILSGKVKSKPTCCGLFTNDPKELPEFCPPTPSWCKYQANGGPSWNNKVKGICCKDFGNDLGKICGTTQKPVNKPPVTPKKKSNDCPT